MVVAPRRSEPLGASGLVAAWVTGDVRCVRRSRNTVTPLETNPLSTVAATSSSPSPLRPETSEEPVQ